MRDDERRKRIIQYRRNEQLQSRRRAWIHILASLSVLLAGLLVAMLGLTSNAKPVWAAALHGASGTRGSAADCGRVRPVANVGLTPQSKDTRPTPGVNVHGCRARVAWPVDNPEVIEPFDPPLHPWLPGHRGVDLAAATGDILLAPADGVIAFRGRVGGKSVVSVRHGNLTSTFEPSQTDFDVGSRVRQGSEFARVQGSSDHCDNHCVHWGVKRADNDYLDPRALAAKRAIVLKPRSR